MLFHQLIALEPGEPRETFINQACGNDLNLRHELTEFMKACT